MSSQYGEDAIILQHFEGRKGRFLDIGAGDGLTFSNTAPLLKVGWTGVMVEPAPSALRWLYQNHPHGSGVEIVPAAITLSASTSIPFWDGGQTGKEFSTTCYSHRQKIAAHSQGDVKYQETRVLNLGWFQLLSMFQGPYEFVNIDVEGGNLDLLADLPFADVAPEMLCIEIDPPQVQAVMMQILWDAGLKHLQVCGGNLLAWR